MDDSKRAYSGHVVSECSTESHQIKELTSFRLYTRRWFVLLTLFMFNISNNIIWISFSAVATKAASYYNKDASKIDLFSSITFFMGMPMSLGVTVIQDRMGMRYTMLLGIGLTAVGGVIRMFSSFSFVGADLNTQYYIALTGQIFAGLANPISVALPTKITQNWFAGGQRTLATVSLAISAPLGVLITQFISPSIVKTAEDIPTLNWVCAIPAVFTLVLCLATVNSSYPPTPPSRSACLTTQKKIPYFQSMKQLLSNRRYLLLCLISGSVIGFFNCFATQTQQLLCAVGYSDYLAGTVIALVIGCGALGSFALGSLSNKTGKMLEVVKVASSLAQIFGIILVQLFRKTDMEAEIIVLSILFGTFGFAYYTLGFELAVEESYPIDQTFGTAMLFFSGQLQGAILIAISDSLSQPLAIEDIDIQVCSKTDPSIASDHSNFVIFANVFNALVVVIFVIFAKVDFKRTKANQDAEALGPQEENNEVYITKL